MLIKKGEYINQDENINIFKYSAGEGEPEHTHEFIEVVYIMSGKGSHLINGTCYNIQRGDLFFVNIGQSHSFSSLNAMEIVNCLVSPEFIDHELINSENALEILTLSSFKDFDKNLDRLIPKVSFKGRELMGIEALINNMLIEFDEKDTNYRTALKGQLFVLLTRIFRAMQRTEFGDILQQFNKITPDILEYIEKNLLVKLSLKELAQKCFYNPSYFSKIFKECYGTSFVDYLHEKRIDEAVRLLKTTILSVEAICHNVGFSDRKQFYKTFKKYTGLTPGMMRKDI